MKRKAFTLIELLITLSIIGVLLSISIISFSGYGASARDAKRITDAEEILARVNAEFVKAIDLSELIIEEKENSLKINGISKKGYQGVTNFSKIKEDSTKFKDPSNNQDYPIAYAQTKIGDLSYVFTQIATICENGGVARLIGNYNKVIEGDSPSLFTKTGATGINIPEDYIENNGKVLPYDIGIEALPLICDIGYEAVNSRCIPIICETGEYLDGNDCKDIVCETGKYLDGNDCIDQWSGDASTGYTFKNLSGSITYPTSCNNLLTDNQFKVGTTLAYNGTKFNDGVYYIKPDSNPAFKAYCDMTTDGGGWTVIVNTSSNEKTNFSPLETGYDLTKSWSWTRIYANKLNPTNASILYAEGNFQKLSYNSTYQAYYNGSYAVQISLDNCQARMGNRCNSNTATRSSWGYFCRIGNPFTAGGGSSASAFPGNYPYQNSDNLGSIKCDSSNRQTNGTEFGTRVMLK